MTVTHFQNERSAIEGLFAAKFASVPVAYENVPFVQPTASAWVRCSIISGRGRRIDTTNWNRFAGIVQIDVFVPEKSGQVEARNLADAAASVMREKQIVKGSVVVTFGAPGFRIPEDALSDGWYRVIVDAPFSRDSKGAKHTGFG